jgi:hypothetical protein
VTSKKFAVSPERALRCDIPRLVAARPPSIHKTPDHLVTQLNAIADHGCWGLVARAVNWSDSSRIMRMATSYARHLGGQWEFHFRIDGTRSQRGTVYGRRMVVA